MPPLLLRVGIAVITGVLFVILGLLYFIPYPQLKTFPVRITTDSTGCHAICSLPLSDARLLKTGQLASIQVETLTGDYQLNGEITAFIESDGGGCENQPFANDGWSGFYAGNTLYKWDCNNRDVSDSDSKENYKVNNEFYVIAFFLNYKNP